jgi:hypothetical protein
MSCLSILILRSSTKTALNLAARRSGRHKQGLEGGVVELDGLGEDPVVLVDHRDGLTRRKRLKAVRCVGADFVEIDDAETDEPGKRLEVEGTSKRWWVVIPVAVERRLPAVSSVTNKALGIRDRNS